MLFFVVFVCCLVAVVRGTPFTECDMTGTLISVDIEGCESLPCYFQPGSRRNVSFTFKPAERSESMNPGALITIENIPFYPTVEPIDACQSMSPSCPLPDEQDVVYEASMQIPTAIPKFPGNLKWNLSDGSSQVVCFMQSIVISDSGLD